MFDIFGKNQANNNLREERKQADSGSLLDVVVPFPASGEKYASGPTVNSSNNSLLSQLDALENERQQVEAEKQAVERARLRSQKAEYERSEQLARIEAERQASLRFEEKANNLAAEIERVRETKFRQSARPEPDVAGNRHHFSPAEGSDGFEQAESASVEQNRYEQNQFERFKRWQRSEESMRSPSRDDNSPRFQRDHDHERHGVPGYRDGRPNYDAADHYRPYPNGDSHHSDQRYGEPDRVPYPSRHPQPEDYRSRHYPETGDIHPNSHPDAKIARNTVDEQTQSSGLYQQNNASNASPVNPGMQLDEIFASILKSWKLVGGFAIVGAVIAGVYAKTLPNKYEAWAELLIDPQGFTLVDKQLTSTGYGGEAMIAYLESQLRIIESTSVLNVVIEKEQLFDDPEFASSGSLDSGFLGILNPLSSGEKSARGRQLILDNMHDKLTISRGNRTFVVSIGMMTENPDKSARIANAIAKAYVSGESGARSKFARDASEDLSDKLDTLRNRVLVAERKVADYKAENGLATSDGKLISEVQLTRINEQLANARVETVNAKTRMDQLRSIDLADVVSGALPAGLNSSTLSQLRVRYAALKSNVDKLSTKLGLKHPERIAADAELRSARGQITREIRRSIEGSRKDFERAKKRQAGLKQQLNTAKAAAAGAGSSLIGLRELERELEAHRSVYENYLLRSRETSEQEGLKTTNARIISSATAPLEKATPNRKVIAGIGLLAGGILGLILALLKGVLLDNSRSKPGRNQYLEGNDQPSHSEFPNRNYNSRPSDGRAGYYTAGYAPHSREIPPRYS